MILENKFYSPDLTEEEIDHLARMGVTTPFSFLIMRQMTQKVSKCKICDSVERKIRDAEIKALL